MLIGADWRGAMMCLIESIQVVAQEDQSRVVWPASPAYGNFTIIVDLFLP